ncbi:MAG: FAD-dependent monooxygenase [Acidimicrobiales bacterium]
MSAHDTDVLIVGAGPVGMTLALELARAGVPHRLIDRAAEPSPLSRAAGIHSRTLQLLERSGVIEPFLDEGLEVRRGEIAMDGTPRASFDLSELDERFPFIIDLPQARTEALLADHLAGLGGRIERGVGLVGLFADADGVDVQLQRDGDEAAEAMRCRWVIGCDGGHSTVRTLAPTQLHGSFKGERVLLVDAECEWDVDWPVLRMSLNRHGLAGSFPFTGRRARFFAQLGDLDLADDPTLDDAQRTLADLLSPTLRLTEAHWITTLTLHHGQVPRYRFGRVLLAGDAAHIHSPAGGQGMNTGMQDAWNLAWKLVLVSRGADEALLDSYDRERHPVGARVVKLTTRATRIAMTTVPGVHRLRDTLVGAMVGRDGVRQRLELGLTELDIGYHHSPIVGEHVRHAADDLVEPGDRLPDAGDLATALPAGRHAALVMHPETADDVTTVLDALGDLAEVIAVVTTPMADLPEGATALVDPDDAIADALGLGASGVVVVRPDAYVGYVTVPVDGDGLRHYRTLLGLPTG